MLPPGTRLGPYAITGLLGEGGMGQVYRATDTNLHRQVALKVLPAALAGDADRLARFQREAEVLAALARGPLPLADALPIAGQIAEALEAAHEAGIIHRDLKPANIKVRPDGTVKVLDFGLAKAMEPPGAAAASAAMQATITTPAVTQAGVILGTAAYLSPEQAAGKPLDKRSDLWAFGVVLLEMLTWRRVFDGETVSHVLVAVLTKEPDWTTLPAPGRRGRCAARDRRGDDCPRGEHRARTGREVWCIGARRLGGSRGRRAGRRGARGVARPRPDA